VPSLLLLGRLLVAALAVLLLLPWPAGLPLLHLDHVLASEGVGAARVAEVAVPGSDHLAVG
jgi:endonuclease/exonuclease/phosphatase family metal-dependent hydrolase